MAGRIAGQGSNWIRRERRIALYLRDRFSCVYCRRSKVADGVTLTLDHVIACDHGGTNASTNLVTACLSCNSAKQAKTVREFSRYLVAMGYDGGVSRRVQNAGRRRVPSKAELAKALAKASPTPEFPSPEMVRD